jgi:hypothetical protein
MRFLLRARARKMTIEPRRGICFGGIGAATGGDAQRGGSPNDMLN